MFSQSHYYCRFGKLWGFLVTLLSQLPDGSRRIQNSRRCLVYIIIEHPIIVRFKKNAKTSPPSTTSTPAAMHVLFIDPFIVYTPTQYPQPTPHRYRASRFESKQTPTGIVNHIAGNLKINITRTAPDALHLRESCKQVRDCCMLRESFSNVKEVAI